MKTKIIMMTALLALLATGCGKDNGRYRLFAENMTAAGDTKLLVNPSDLVTKWLEGENINVNGTVAPIAKDGSNYVVDVQSEVDASTLYCIYPGTTNANGNVVAVTNNSSSGGTITLSQLAVNFHSNGSHEVIFPMAAKATASAENMEFKHLTAGFRFSLSSASEMEIHTFKVYVYCSGAATGVNPGSIASYTVKWANEGLMPLTPIGEIGSITDRAQSYGSEMVFGMMTEGVDGVTINSTPKQFCVPLNLCSGNKVKRITVVGLGSTGDMLFAKTIGFGDTGITIARNKMYPVRAIAL
jgi:hypothetical protein